LSQSSVLLGPPFCALDFWNVKFAFVRAQSLAKRRSLSLAFLKMGSLPERTILVRVIFSLLSLVLCPSFQQPPYLPCLIFLPPSSLLRVSSFLKIEVVDSPSLPHRLLKPVFFFSNAPLCRFYSLAGTYVFPCDPPIFSLPAIFLRIVMAVPHFGCGGLDSQSWISLSPNRRP